MSNIKNKITIKTIFFIIIVAYNKKFILNASKAHNNRMANKIYNKLKNMHDEKIAETYTKQANNYKASNMLKKAGEIFGETAILYNKLALYYKNEAKQSTKTSLEIFQCIKLAKEAYESSISSYNEQAKCYDALRYDHDNRKATINMSNQYENITKMYKNILNTYHDLLKHLHQQKNLDIDNIAEVYNHIFLTYEYGGLYFKKYADCLTSNDGLDKFTIKEYKNSGDFYYSGVEFYLKELKRANNAFKAQDYLQEVPKWCNDAAESYIIQARKLEEMLFQYGIHYKADLMEDKAELIQAYNNIAKSYEKQKDSLLILGRTEDAKEAHNKIEKLYKDKAKEFNTFGKEIFLEGYCYSAECYAKLVEFLVNSSKQKEVVKMYEEILDVYENAEQCYQNMDEPKSNEISEYKLLLNNIINEIHTNKKKFEEYIEKAIISKNEKEIEENYHEAYRLNREETNSRIISLKRDPFKTTLRTSAIISFLAGSCCFLNKSVIFEKLKIEYWQNEIIIGLAATATVLATGISIMRNRYQYQELFKIHKMNLENNKSINEP